MEEFVIIANQTLTNQEEVIYSNSKGAVVKTILLFNSNEVEKKVTLTFDGVAFDYVLAPGETYIISSPILTKEIKGVGERVNIHITGLQL